MKKYVILIPIYNDRESLTKLIENINSEIEGINSEISIVVINDASSQQIIDDYQNTENINSIEIVNMKENRGHARCIATGLKYINEKEDFDYVIPMDGDGEDNHFTTGAIKNLGECDKGDWWRTRTGIVTRLNEFHEYSVEWEASDLVYRVDGKEVYRNVGEGDKYPEAMFAILNYAKITDSPMEGEWVMEVDWVKHEFRK